VDGEQVATGTTASALSYTAGGSNTVIGCHGNGQTSWDFTGKIDEVHIYNRVITNSEIVALHGLVGHWKLTETSGTSAVDSTLNVSHGTYQNGVSLAASSSVPGYGAVAPVFDGTNDQVAIPNESLYDVSGAISVAGWIKAASLTKAWQAAITKGDSSWRIAREGSTDFLMWGCNGLTPAKVDSVTSVNDAKWHHVAGVYDGSTLKIYIDGKLDNSVSASGTVSNNSYQVLFGENAEATGRHWNGSFYDVRVYNRAITLEEVTQLYGSGFTGVVITKWVELQ
jgi:hypothetical protein